MHPSCSAPARRARVLVAAALLAVAGLLGCCTRPDVRADPVPEAASRAFAAATAALREAERPTHAGERERARELSEEALALAPDWVAPQRLLDDLLRDELRGVEALAVHLTRLAGRRASRPGSADARADARELYLAGRLEGRDGDARFRRALELDSSLAWSHHGDAFAKNGRGDARGAVASGGRALARARDGWERSFFSLSLARFLVAANDRDEAIALLLARIGEPDASEVEQAWLGAEAVGMGLEARRLGQRVESYQRGLELLRSALLTESEIVTLVTRMRRSGSLDDPDGHGLAMSLAAQQSPARDRLRAELLLDEGATPLALGLLERALQDEGRAAPAGPLVRAARFAAGDFSASVEQWLREMPRAFLDDEGVPLRPALARVVRASRTWADSSRASDGGAELEELGAALVEAGWFREARSVAARLASHDLDRALALDARATAGAELIEGIRRLVHRIDLERGLATPVAQESVDVAKLLRGLDLSSRGDSTGSSDVHSLDELLAAMGPLVARANVFLGGETSPARMSEELVRSPRMHYGPIAELVHPGPAFSASDDRADFGRAAAPVPGLAAVMQRLGRFAIFGEVTGGGGPDGSILPLLWSEQRAGTHLGVPWHGTIAWCEGADLMSRAGRRGAQISAAALHEGYWLDVAAVRGEHASWGALCKRFEGAGGRARAERVLAERGLALESLEFDTRAEGDDRPPRSTRIGALLGEGQRVRLAVSRDRALANGTTELAPVPLDELIRVTATHEEGHLCDRTRFLPLSKNLPALFAFVLDCGFSPNGIMQALEYRAQLVALCDAPDPRVALAQVLETAELGGGGLTPHAGGYALLLGDLLELLEARLDADPRALPEIDRTRTRVHQLHHLPAETVRDLARALAKKKRMAH
ncbi:MAG: hypothetical protein ACKVWV_02160 [Planctomycetota bacterium]